MTRVEENKILSESLGKITKEVGDKLICSPETAKAIYNANIIGFLEDISKSLAVIADIMRGGKE